MLPVLMVALILRLFHLGSRRALDMDEAYWIWTSQLPPLQIISEQLKDAHPPLYLLLLHFWTELFGVSDFATRSLSVVFGLGLMVAAYFILKKLFSTQVAILVTLLLSFSPLHIFYSREARMYVLLALLAFLIFSFLIKALNQNRKKDWF